MFSTDLHISALINLGKFGFNIKNYSEKSKKVGKIFLFLPVQLKHDFFHRKMKYLVNLFTCLCLHGAKIVLQGSFPV